MDRNSAIGLTLIAALLFSYFYFFSPDAQPPAQQPVAEKSAPSVSDSTVNNPTQGDSALDASYGELSSYAQGKESSTTVETQDLKITFSNRGGIVKEAELKKYK